MIGALMIREVIALYGRRGLGAGWIVAEPLSFAIPVLILWSIVRDPYNHGLPIVGFLWSGYMPILLFRHIGNRALSFIRVSSGLMYHRQVTILDIFIARCTFEVCQNVAAAFVVFIMFYLLDDIEMPAKFSLFLIGYLYMIWWCVSIALFIGVLSERTEWVEKVWQPVAYTYLFYSGFGYMAGWLPPVLRNIALYQPSLQAYEMIRAGLFGNEMHSYYDFGYTSFVLGGMTLVGLMGLRSGRKYVVID